MPNFKDIKACSPRLVKIKHVLYIYILRFLKVKQRSLFYYILIIFHDKNILIEINYHGFVETKYTRDQVTVVYDGERVGADLGHTSPLDILTTKP